MPRARTSSSSRLAPGLAGPLEAGRDADGADREAVEQVGQAVVVVGIGMREDDHVEPPDAPRPERRGDHPAADVGVAHPAAVVEGRPPVGRPDHHRQAVADGQDLGLGRARAGSGPSAGPPPSAPQAIARPTSGAPTAIGERRPSSPARAGRRTPGPSPRAGPARRRGPIARPSPSGRPPRSSARRRAAGPGERHAQRRPDRREHQRQARQQQGQRGQRDQRDVDQDADRRDQVEPQAPPAASRPARSPPRRSARPARLVRPIRPSIRHQGSSRRSRTSSGSSSGASQARTAGTHQTIAATARNESWQPTSNRSDGLSSRVTRAAPESRFAGPTQRSRQPGQAGPARSSPPTGPPRAPGRPATHRRPSPRSPRHERPLPADAQAPDADPQDHGQDLQVQPRDRQQVRRPGPGEGVVDLGVDLLPAAEQQGRGQRGDRRVEPRGQRPAAPGPDRAEPPGPGPVLAGRVGPDAGRLVDRQAEPDPPGPEDRPGVELAGVERPLDRRERPGRLDRPARPPGRSGRRRSRPATRPEAARQPRPSLIPVRARTVRVEPRSPGPSSPLRNVAASTTTPRTQDGRRLARSPVGPRRVVRRQVGPPVMMPAARDRQRRPPRSPRPRPAATARRSPRSPPRPGPGRPRRASPTGSRDRSSHHARPTPRSPGAPAAPCGPFASAPTRQASRTRPGVAHPGVRPHRQAIQCSRTWEPRLGAAGSPLPIGPWLGVVLAGADA